MLEVLLPKNGSSAGSSRPSTNNDRLLIRVQKDQDLGFSLSIHYTHDQVPGISISTMHIREAEASPVVDARDNGMVFILKDQATMGLSDKRKRLMS